MLQWSQCKVRLPPIHLSLSDSSPHRSLSFLGIHYSHTANCDSAHVGYTFNPALLGYSGLAEHDKVILKSLSGSLIINALAAALAGISLFFGFFAWLWVVMLLHQAHRKQMLICFNHLRCASRAMEVVRMLPCRGKSAR